MDWFLYNHGLRHERVKGTRTRSYSFLLLLSLFSFISNELERHKVLGKMIQ